MNWKNWLTTVGGAFGTGVLGVLTSGAVPTTKAAIVPFVAGCVVGGLVGVYHLYQDKPGARVALDVATNAVEQAANKLSKP